MARFVNIYKLRNVNVRTHYDINRGTHAHMRARIPQLIRRKVAQIMVFANVLSTTNRIVYKCDVIVVVVDVLTI